MIIFLFAHTHTHTHTLHAASPSASTCKHLPITYTSNRWDSVWIT